MLHKTIQRDSQSGAEEQGEEAFQQLLAKPPWALLNAFCRLVGYPCGPCQGAGSGRISWLEHGH